MNSLGMQTNEMSAVFPALIPNARFDTEQVRVGAVDALSQRHTNLGDDDVAGTADCKQVLTYNISRAALEIGFLTQAEDPAAHEDMRMGIVIGVNVLQTFVHPVDTVLATNHKDILV